MHSTIVHCCSTQLYKIVSGFRIVLNCTRYACRVQLYSYPGMHTIVPPAGTNVMGTGRRGITSQVPGMHTRVRLYRVGTYPVQGTGTGKGNTRRYLPRYP